MRRKLGRRGIFVAWLTALLMPAVAATAVAEPDAQQEEEAASLTDLGLDFGLDFDLDALDLESELALLAAEDIVISATRHAQRIGESPSAITVITREEILASGAHDLIDLLRRVPGADVYRISQMQAAVGLRSGTSESGDLLLMLVDGRDAATHFLGQPQWLSTPFDLDSIERIEVLRGPGSTLYGANALQGVINITTRAPAEEPFVGEGTVLASGLNGVRTDLRAHGSLGQFGYWASAGYERFAPYDDPQELEAETFRGRIRGDWQGGDDRRGTLEAGLILTEAAIHTAIGSGTASLRWPYLLGRLRLGRTELHFVADQADTVFDVHLGLALPPTDSGPGQVLAEVPVIDHPVRSLELGAQHRVDLFANHRLTFGTQARLMHHRGGSLVRCVDPGDPADFLPSMCEPAIQYELRGGVFAQDEWRIFEGLTLTSGIRLDISSLSVSPGLSPRLALVWLPLDDHAFRASAARAYRKPTFGESHAHVILEPADDVPQDLIRRLQYTFAVGGGNPDLVNETADSFELGWRGRFLGGKMIGTVDLFRQRRAHAIYMSNESFRFVTGLGGIPTIPADAGISYMNRPLPDWSYGGEATLSIRASGRLWLQTSYAHDRVFRVEEDETGSFIDVPIDAESVHQLGLSGRLEIVSGIFMTLDTRWDSAYVKHTSDPLSVVLPLIEERVGGGMPLVNCSLRYRHQTDGGNLELGLVVFNALDNRVRQVAGIERDGRTYGAASLARRTSLMLRASF